MFNDSGSRLYAVTHAGAVEVTLFEDEPLPRREKVEGLMRPSDSGIEPSPVASLERLRDERLPSIVFSEFGVDFEAAGENAST